SPQIRNSRGRMRWTAAALVLYDLVNLNQAAIARRCRASSVIFSIDGRGGTTRLLAGSFSVDMAAWSGPAAVPGARVETCTGSSARVDQILLSMAMVADQVETLTLVVSNPEVNNLRINRSRSTDSESSNSIARQPP